jgi:hypothetical protein
MNFGYRTSFQLIDKGNIEVFGPVGSAFNLQTLSKSLANYQSGFVSNYAFAFMISLLLILGLFSSLMMGLDIFFFNEFFFILLFCYVIFCFIS